MRVSRCTCEGFSGREAGRRIGVSFLQFDIWECLGQFNKECLMHDDNLAGKSATVSYSFCGGFVGVGKTLLGKATPFNTAVAP